MHRPSIKINVQEDLEQRTKSIQKETDDIIGAIAITRPKSPADRNIELLQQYRVRGQRLPTLYHTDDLNETNDELQRGLDDRLANKVKGTSLFDKTIGSVAGAVGRGALGIARVHIEAEEQLRQGAGGLAAEVRPLIPGVQETSFDVAFQKARERGLGLQDAFAEAAPESEQIGVNVGELVNPFIRPSAISPGAPGGPPADFHIGKADLGAEVISPLNFIPVFGTTPKQLLGAVRGGKNLGDDILRGGWTWIANEKITLTGDRVVDKLIQGLAEAKPVHEETAKLRHVELARRSEIQVNLQKRFIKETDPVKRTQIQDQMNAARAGELPKTAFEMPEHLKFTEDDITYITNKIAEAGPAGDDILAANDVTNAVNSFIDMMLTNKVPILSEVKLMEKVFGPAWTPAMNRLRTKWQRGGRVALDIAGAPISTLSSYDLSAPFRQGYFLGMRMPKKAVGAAGRMTRAFFDEKYAGELQIRLQKKENYQKFVRAKMFFGDIQSGASFAGRKTEEAFFSSLPGRIPVFGWPIKASNRAYTTFLNQMRYDYANGIYKGWTQPNSPGWVARNLSFGQKGFENRFMALANKISGAEKTRGRKMTSAEVALWKKDWKEFSRSRGYTEAEIKDFNKFLTMNADGSKFGLSIDDMAGLAFSAKSLGVVTKRDMEQLAQLTNYASGRGPLGKGQIADVANVVFYAPRLATSRFAMPVVSVAQAAGIVKASPMMRREAARMLVTGFGSMLAVAGGIATGAKIYKQDIQVESDWRSTDFGKIRVGETRIDMMAGFSQVFRFMAQMTTQQSKSTGSGTISDKGVIETFARFLQSKFSPAAGLVTDVARKETFIGEELVFVPKADDSLLEKIRGNTLWQRVVPLFIQDVVEAMEVQGILKGGMLALPGFFGGGITTFENSRSVIEKRLKTDLVITDDEGNRITDWQDERITPAQRRQVMSDDGIRKSIEDTNRRNREDYLLNSTQQRDAEQRGRDELFVRNKMSAREWKEDRLTKMAISSEISAVLEAIEGGFESEQEFGGLVGLALSAIGKNEKQRTPNEQALADWYDILEDHIIDASVFDAVNFDPKNLTDEELRVQSKGIDLDGLQVARDRFLSELSESQIEFVLENTHPSRTPIESIYLQGQRDLRKYWDVPKKHARNDAELQLWDDYITTPPNQQRNFEIMHPSINRMKALVSRDRKLIRSRDKRVDDLLVTFYDAVPQHPSNVILSRAGLFPERVKAKVVEGADQLLDESLNLKGIQR